MNVEFITQPERRFGEFLIDHLGAGPPLRRIVIVSAFAALQTVMRLKFPLLSLRDAGARVSLVLGLDMGGTSKEVLQEVASWNIEVTLIKNRIPGHTFHPKIYLLEDGGSAKIVVGSNNLTEGGLFRNYESSCVVEYALPADANHYAKALQELQRFLAPAGNIARPLNNETLAALLARADIPTENEARERTRTQTRYVTMRESGDEQLFGSEIIPPPPPLPASVLQRLMAGVNARRQANARHGQAGESVAPAVGTSTGQIYPAAFYMSLPTLQGPNIPGEGRIPLAAIELAHEFWGWPDRYQRLESPRAGQERVYHQWKPYWRIWNAAQPDVAATLEVRMYMYDNSSDFRFYARPLVNAGADLGDIVRIIRVGGQDYEFDCALARAGTPTHEEWRAFCVTQVRNSTRTFGYG